MNTKILAVGLVCLSAAAMGQSNGATEKRMHKPITVTAVADTQDSASNGSASSKEVSKKQAVDDWQAPTAKTADSHRVAPSMMSDGKAASSENAGQATVKPTSSDGNSITHPRDMSTGQPSGRERPRPIGSSGQDGVSTSREASTGMATGKKAAADSATGAQPNAAPRK